ncbi:MAG: hypothetical protein R2851_15090 [Caldilineaceae bacterium]
MMQEQAAAPGVAASISQFSRPPRTFWGDAFYRLRRHPIGMVGLVIVVLLVLLALLGLYLALLRSQRGTSPSASLPSLAHPMGADDFGRDTLSRIMVARAGVAGVAGIIAGHRRDGRLVAGHHRRYSRCRGRDHRAPWTSSLRFRPSCWRLPFWPRWARAWPTP